MSFGRSPAHSGGLVDVYREVKKSIGILSFGWKARHSSPGVAPTTTPGPMRVALVPSDKTGRAGPVTLNVRPGPIEIVDANGNSVGKVRPLRVWERSFHIVIWTNAPTNLVEDAEAEHVAGMELLMEQVIRAFHHAAGSQLSWGEPEWETDPRDTNVMRSLSLPGTLKTIIFDEVVETATPTPVLTKSFEKE